MDHRQLFQSVNGDLLGCDRWTASLEGAFTRTAKIALLNVLQPAALSKLLFGCRLLPTSFTEVHGRSFLNSAWAKFSDIGATGRSVLPGFLSNLCGSWATSIASDARLRLCRSCADVGYHTSIFQIDALERCPLHGELLVTECHYCGVATPRYALTLEAFLSPMQCVACGVGYGKAWISSANLAGWTGPRDVEPFQRVARRLRMLSDLGLEWPAASAWIDEPSADLPARRRVNVFHAAMKLSGEPGEETLPVVAQSGPCLPTSIQKGPPRLTQRTAIYKSIRRHVVKRLQLKRRCGGAAFGELFYLHRVSEAIVPQRASCPPALHAFVLWTKRSESKNAVPMACLHGGPYGGPSARELHLRTSLLLWPTDVQVEDRVWGHFVWRTFLEDLWTARRWNEVAVKLEDPLERGDRTEPQVQQNRTRFMEELTRLAPKMSCLLEPFPSGLTHFTWQQGDERWFNLISLHRNGEPWNA